MTAVSSATTPNSWFRVSAASVRLADVMIARLVPKRYNLAWRFRIPRTLAPVSSSTRRAFTSLTPAEKSARLNRVITRTSPGRCDRRRSSARSLMNGQTMRTSLRSAQIAAVSSWPHPASTSRTGARITTLPLATAGTTSRPASSSYRWTSSDGLQSFVGGLSSVLVFFLGLALSSTLSRSYSSTASTTTGRPYFGLEGRSVGQARIPDGVLHVGLWLVVVGSSRPPSSPPSPLRILRASL